MSSISLSDTSKIEKHLSAVIDIPLSLVSLKFSKDISQLDKSWRGRRKALGKLISKLHFSPPIKADNMIFPQQQLSLTHSGSWSVAAGTRSLKVLGIGVDFEVHKNIDHVATRLFLTNQERKRINNDNRQILRLWSIKEAIFKSDPNNHECWVWNYELCNSASHSGRAFRVGCNKRFYYISLNLLEGVLAIAVCTGRNPL